MMRKNLLKHPLVRLAGQIVNVAALILLATHGMYAWQAHTTAENWEERVLIIEREWQFRLLNTDLPEGSETYSILVPKKGYYGNPFASS